MKRGCKFSKEHCENISKSKMGHHHSEETKRKIGQSRKGKTYEEIYGLERATEMRKNCSNSFKGRKFTEGTRNKISAALKDYYVEHPVDSGYWKGKSRDESTRRKISETLKERYADCDGNRKGIRHTDETKAKLKVAWAKKEGTDRIRSADSLFKKGTVIPHKKGCGCFRCDPKPLTKEQKKELSKRNERLGIRPPVPMKGKDHWNWKGGTGMKGYAKAFNAELKEFIRDRDGRTCQRCDKTEQENGKKLTIHHIDHNKKNSDDSNLVTLCVSCNTYFTFHRIESIEFFKEHPCHVNVFS